ncbi:beta-galactosidase [Pectobacterium actinidiae]|uniref:Beta-galactosidase n=3 Tax=Pectobacterium actinidiae TaxID=1507808 RepID=A0A1V2QY90_9GAMM|nr:beta-galactosidase [Pectobacterium actinidiae]KHN91392.1 glycoside hydrolase family protein [Pectobacterium actinidiae]ONK01261.1 beta-galactosidase [Pectobacterium actinidiae]WEF13567.1 beta-galactosidase [Pectobacterium actinidiae]
MSYLYYGVAYYDEYMPEDRLAKDISLMIETGINVVRIAESTWSTLEPKEGEFNFYHIDRVLDAMHGAGISVIIGTPTYAVPAWLAAKHPDILVTTIEGHQKYGPRQIMDIVNPTFRLYAERIIRALLEHVQHHPAIIGWQLDNETKHYGNVGHHMQKGFIYSLKEKYASLDRLNYDFGLDYWSNRIDNWDDFPSVEKTINASLACAFSRYQRQQVTDYLAWQAGLVREYAKPHQFVTHNFDFEWRGYSFGLQPSVDHFTASQVLDIAGVDIYHPSQKNLTGREIAFGGAISRALKMGKNYFVLETQAQGFAQWTPFPGQLRLQAFSHIASGAAMVSYWHWHSIHNSYETYWKGLLSHDFSRNATWQEATTIGADFARLSPKLIGLRAVNDVAILISNEAMDALNQFRPGDEQGNVYNDIFRRFHDAMYDHNIGLDIINDVNEGTMRYKAIIIPGLYAADDGLLTRINHYIEQGGRALIGFKSGFSNEHVKVRSSTQPGILYQACGVSYNQFTLPNDVQVTACIPTLNCREHNKVELWMELLTPAPETRMLLRYQHPEWNSYAAATEADYGKGRALYVGFLPHKKLISQLFNKLTNGLKLTSHTSSNTYPLITRTMSNSDGNLIHFLFNYSGDACDTTAETEGIDLLSGEKVFCGEPLRLNSWGLRIIES